MFLTARIEQMALSRTQVWWCCFNPKCNLNISFKSEQSPLRLAARTSEQAKCLTLVNQLTWARQWSNAWMSSWVTTLFIWVWLWILFWHRTIWDTEESKPPLTFPLQSSQEKCLSLLTAQPECFMASSRSLTYGFVANVFKSISWHFWLLVKKLERNPCCGFPWASRSEKTWHPTCCCCSPATEPGSCSSGASAMPPTDFAAASSSRFGRRRAREGKVTSLLPPRPSLCQVEPAPAQPGLDF